LLKFFPDPYHFPDRFKAIVILSFRKTNVMKTLSMLFVFAILTFGLLAPEAHAAVRKCSKELEDDFKKFKRKMVFKGFSKEVNRNKNPNFVEWLEKEHAQTVKHEEAHAEAAGKWGKKIIYRTYEYWGKKYAVTGCVPFKKGLPAEIALKAALAPEQPSDQDLKIAKFAKLALQYEKDYRKVKAASKKCAKMFSASKKAKCKKSYWKKLSKHPFLTVKSVYSW